MEAQHGEPSGGPRVVASRESARGVFFFDKPEVHGTSQPRAPVLHGLVDPTHFGEFQRRLREELATSQPLTTAINGSKARSGGHQQPTGLFSEDVSQGSESEGEGEDIEGVEFESAEESSDEETSQDRAMIDDAPQDGQNPLVQYGQVNAAMETDSESDGLSQLLARRFKRQAPDGATNPLQTRRRPRVLLSSSESSAEEGSPSWDRSQPASNEHFPLPEEEDGETDHLMPDAGDSTLSQENPPSELEDDGWPGDFELSLEDEFAETCTIVPRPRWADSQPGAAVAAPSAPDASGKSPQEPRMPPDAPLHNVVQSGLAAAPLPPCALTSGAATARGGFGGALHAAAIPPSPASPSTHELTAAAITAGSAPAIGASSQEPRASPLDDPLDNAPQAAPSAAPLENAPQATPSAAPLENAPQAAPSAIPLPPSVAASSGSAQEPRVAAVSTPAFSAAEASTTSVHAPRTAPLAPQTAPAVALPIVDQCLDAAHHFNGLGVVTLTFNMRVELENGKEKKKPIGLMNDWAKECTLSNCLRDGVRPRQSCLAILTGASDIYALDVDTGDQGGEAFADMLAEHGDLPADTPWEWTGHRPGRHFLFSLSKSKEAGLLSGKGRTRLTYKGKKVGLDSRGEGGMLFVGPTSYRGLDGTVRQYEWVQEIAPHRSNLRALPGWLIGIINNSDAPAPAHAPRGRDSVAFRPARPLEDPEPEDVLAPPPPAILRRVEECVAATGDPHSRFNKVKRSAAGDTYVFRVNGARVCPYGGRHSGSNNFCILVREKELQYHCNSGECCDIRPRRVIGELTPQQYLLGGETAAVGENDKTVYDKLTKPFVDNWAFQGDKGGSRIAAQMYSGSPRLWHDGKSWWIWDGQRFKQTEVARVRYIIMHQLSTVFERVRGELERELEEATDDEEKSRLAGLLKSLRTYNTAHEVSETLKIMQGEMFRDLAGELDNDPDILNVRNGVVHLRTGQLDVHRPGYLCTKMADVNFRGLNHPTPTTDDFLANIFNNDWALIDFMQRLWGYSINGSTSEEIIVFLLGSGGNGKGVCKQMLESTLGDYYGVMSKDAVVKPPGQRPPSKGAATGYLAELRGKRVAVADETSPGERVDLGLVLMMTGGGQITSRLLYQNNVSFRCSHTPFIQTNYDPEIPPTLAKKPNVERRLIVVQFPNEYVSDDKFDETNPKHRRVDVGLKGRMELPEVREEFLTFLVKGGCAWYANPEILRRHPPAIQAATVAWLQRGDKLQTFLQSSHHCRLDPDGIVWEEDFWVRFQDFAGVKITKEELSRQMGEKDYKRTKRAGRCNGEPSQRYSCYAGIKWPGSEGDSESESE